MSVSLNGGNEGANSLLAALSVVILHLSWKVSSSLRSCSTRLLFLCLSKVENHQREIVVVWCLLLLNSSLSTSLDQKWKALLWNRDLKGDNVRLLGVIFQHCDTFRLAIYWPPRWLPMFFKVIFSYVWPSRNSRVVAQKIAFPIQIASVVPSPDHAILSRSGAEKTVNSRALWPKSQAHKSVQKTVLLILYTNNTIHLFLCCFHTFTN